MSDIAKLTAGVLLAETPGIDNPAIQYGLVGLIAWMVIRECFALVRLMLDRKSRKDNGGCQDHDELVRIRAELEALKSRLEQLERGL